MSETQQNAEQKALEALKIATTSHTMPSPLTVRRGAQEAKTLVNDEYQPEVDEAGAALDEANDALLNSAVKEAVKVQSASIDEQFALTRQMFAVQDDFLTAQITRLTNEEKALEKGPLKKALKALKKRSKDVEKQIETLEDIHERMSVLLQDTTKLNQGAPSGLDLNDDGVVNAADLSEIEDQIQTLVDSLENDPAVKAAKKIIAQIHTGLQNSADKQESISQTFQTAAHDYNSQINAIRAEIVTEREAAQVAAQTAFDQIINEKDETMGVVSAAGSAMVKQETSDWMHYKKLQAKEGAEVAANTAKGALVGIFEGIVAAVSAPVLSAIESYKKPTASNKAKNALLEKRSKRNLQELNT